MPQVYPNEGEVQLTNDLLTADARENWLLKLYKTNYTPTETDTAASYTECDFDGYAAKTLTRTRSGSTWQAPTSEAPNGSPAWSAETAVAQAVYGTEPQTFICTGSTGNTVYGYFIVGATSGKVIFAELFTTSRVLNNGDSLSITPRFQFA